MSLFKSKCSKSKLPNRRKIAEHSKVFYLKFTDSSRQERHTAPISNFVRMFKINQWKVLRIRTSKQWVIKKQLMKI